MKQVLTRLLNVVAVLAVVAVLVALLARTRSEGPPAVVTIGTGSISGLYFPTGGAIAKVVNRKADQYGFRCLVESTDGSLHNLKAVLSGELEFGIVQADLEYEAVHGQGEWYVKGPQTELRTVCGLHEETVTVVASVDSGIESLSDLRGKRVNIGNQGSGVRKNAIEILEAVGLDWASDLEAVDGRPQDAVDAIQTGEIDAFFYTVGHPNRLVENAMVGRKRLRFVPLPADDIVDKLPYFRTTSIPGGLYSRAADPGDVQTVGVMAVLVTSERVDERFAYAVAMNLFENLDEFKGLHPAFALMSRDKMLQGFAAPIHPGAQRYYGQSGIRHVAAEVAGG